MKAKFFFLIAACLLLSAVHTLQSQVRLSTERGNVVGFQVGESAETLKIYTKKGDTVLVNKAGIDGREKIYSDITMNNGLKYKATIISIDGHQYTIETKDGKTETIDKRNVRYVEYDASKQSYFSAGLSFYMPGGANVVAGYMSDYDIGIRVCGGTMGSTLSGYQANLLYNLTKAESLEVNLSLAIGGMNMKDIKNFDEIFLFKSYAEHFDCGKYASLPPSECTLDFTYYGIFADLNLSGIFFELGLARMIDYDDTNLMLAFGYVYRFN